MFSTQRNTELASLSRLFDIVDQLEKRIEKLEARPEKVVKTERSRKSYKDLWEKLDKLAPYSSIVLDKMPSSTGAIAGRYGKGAMSVRKTGDKYVVTKLREVAR